MDQVIYLRADLLTSPSFYALACQFIVHMSDLPIRPSTYISARAAGLWRLPKCLLLAKIMYLHADLLAELISLSSDLLIYHICI